MKTVNVQTNYTVAEIAELFAQARAMLDDKQFAKWVDEFWTMFSQDGGTNI